MPGIPKMKFNFWFYVELLYVTRLFCGRRGGIMVSVFVSGSSGPGLSPGWGHCVVFLGKTLYSDSACLHPGVYMGTSVFNAGGTPAMG